MGSDPDVHPQSTAANASGPELVFALTRPTGTPNDSLLEALDGILLSYGYKSWRVDLSEILADTLDSQQRTKINRSTQERLTALMNAGNQLCAQHGTAAAVGLYGITEMHKIRRLHNGNREGSEICEMPRNAFVFDSLKRPAEVEQLRKIYGDRFILIGLQASRETRIVNLADKIAPESPSLDSAEVREIAEQLLRRDLKESDDYGQNILKAFPMSDIVIDIDRDVHHQTKRFLDLLFGRPDPPAPEADEFGMQLASSASLRSPELGLRVGAALLNRQRTIISLGVNAHPMAATTPAYDASLIAIKKLILAVLRDLGAEILKKKIMQRLRTDPDRLVNDLLDGTLASSQIREITEFQLPVHAEMSALLDALRTGGTIEGAKLYVTAYPCHGCAKHLLALGIDVCYLEPYSKSRTAAMYGVAGTAAFSPFTGIAPRRFESLFNGSKDRKDESGIRITWDARTRKMAQPRVNMQLTQDGIAQRELGALSRIATDSA
ncbi:hypothetical protein [Nucisporomicrobium flavum]|uniref:hypothetical protein n=1 Tax=Nucisporomicrobium flavum TaxID=2785915 RepID=UPI0018F66C8C|nr:hypothetical protein [Nucisporomicrobium flavum]